MAWQNRKSIVDFKDQQIVCVFKFQTNCWAEKYGTGNNLVTD